MFTATAAYPYVHEVRAVAALRGELRDIVARASAGAPDWTTLQVDGPTRIIGAHQRAWYVWTATVSAALTARD